MKLSYIAIMLLLSSCAPQQSPLAGYPQEYQTGYEQGCYSGKSAAGNPWFHLTKDVIRFQKDKLYAQGWNDGLAVCKGDYENLTRMMYN